MIVEEEGIRGLNGNRKIQLKRITNKDNKL